MNENYFKDVINKELMIIRSTAQNKAEVIDELSRALYAHDYVSDTKKFIADVYLRESEGITGIGQGIAIPHGKSEAVKQTTLAIAVLKDPIEWETLDGKKVKVVIMFAVKAEDAEQKHILLLQKVATLLAHDDFIERLLQVTDKDELYDLLAK